MTSLGFKTSELVNKTASPPIPAAYKWAAAYTATTQKPLIDVLQGAPGSGPHEILQSALSQAAPSAEGNRYGQILGQPQLRELLVDEMKDIYGRNVDLKASDIGLTAGCNLAFYATIMAVASAGDEVILPCPWYFNHQMTLQMIGVSVIPLPTWPDRVFLPSLSDCESLITPRTRAIVLISPNNPTGATYPPSLIESFALLAETHGIALILDETYRDFLLSSDGEQAVPHTLFQHSSPASTSKLEWRWRATLVHLFSFSKSYAIPGQRLGAIVASPDLLKQIATVLDCIQICPPRAIQLALSSKVPLSPPTSSVSQTQTQQQYVITSLRPHILSVAQAVKRRHAIFHEALQGSVYRVEGGGGYFTFLWHPFATGKLKLEAEAGAGVEADTEFEFCKRFVEQEGVLMLPAKFFAPVADVRDECDITSGPTAAIRSLVKELDSWVRVSVANVDDEQIREVARRLIAFSETSSSGNT